MVNTPVVKKITALSLFIFFVSLDLGTLFKKLKKYPKIENLLILHSGHNTADGSVLQTDV